jgi:hypothetical protein
VITPAPQISSSAPLVKSLRGVRGVLFAPSH